MAENIKLVYKYAFEDGTSKVFEVLLDSETLSLVSKPLNAASLESPPKWAELESHQCENCTLSPSKHKYCPVALNLVGVAEAFKDLFSYEKVSVTVAAEERAYFKLTSVQEGLSPLIGVIMATSGCPVMDHLKPMARFHLPFASIEETAFRMASMYLMSRYFLNRSGKAADWSLDGLADVYSEVGRVNRDFAQRLSEAAKRDASVNALVNLDCFATLVPLKTEETLEVIKKYFSAYI